MNALIDTAVHHARTVLSVLVLVLITGFVAYLTIPKEANRDIPIPIVFVQMSHDGISPEDAERLLVRPMEQELRSIEGIKEMRSTAAEGLAYVVLEFEAGFDIDQALVDVREKVDLVKPDLPEDTDEPTVNEVNVGLFPVLVVTMAGDVPERTLLKLARDLQDELEGLPGVLSADIAGDREEVLEVIVDPARLQSYNISQEELLLAVTRNNQLVAAGALDTGYGRFSVKVPGLFESAKDVLELPIKVSGDGVVTLGDITTVRRGFKDATSFARINGRPGVALEIKKRLGENIIDTIADVRRVVGEQQRNWPANVEVGFIQDESEQIRTMLTDLQNNVLSAVLLVMIVVVAALGLRTAGLVGLAVPASFLFGILLLSAMGLTVNIVVLFALILAVGMLVDGAIVVTEYADRKMSEGLHRREAYALAAKRMAWPITASTATTLAASESGDVRQLPGITGAYARMLDKVIRFPLVVLAVALAVLIGVQFYYWSLGRGVEFFPDVEPEQALVHVHARGNLSTAEKDALVREVEHEVLQVAGLETVYARTGAGGEGDEVAEDVVGTIFVEFADWSLRRPAAEILEEIRLRTTDLAGIKVEAREPDVGPPTGKDIQVELRSRFPERIDPVVQMVRRKLEQMDGVIDVEDERPLPGIEWELEVDRAQAGRFGADILTVGKLVQLVTNGIKVDEYRPDDVDEEIDIRVRYPMTERNITQLDELRLQTNQGLVPISNFVTRVPKPKTGTLKRTDGARAITVQANVVEGVLPDDKVTELKAWLQGVEIDPEVSVRFKGADEDQKEAAAFLQRAFGIALFIMAIILVTQFNSFYHAFLILTAVIMSTVGVMAGLIITGQTFGIVMTGIGIIALAGIVVNNNIVLIDTYQRLRKDGMEAMEAVVRTGAQRLRPVMLTTITTICGLLPMVFQANIDFFTRSVAVGAPSTQWWVQLSTAVVFGLGFATILTLMVTPSLLALGAQVSARLERRRQRRAARAQAAAPQAAE